MLKMKYTLKQFIHRVLQNTQIPIYFLIVFVFASIINPALKLRPAGDDYCFAAKSNLNLFASLYLWYETWIGELTGILFQTLFVGIPSIYLPMTLVSIFPFLAGLIMVGITQKKLIFSDPKLQSTGSTVGAILVFAIMWFIYLWFPTFPREVVASDSLIIFGTSQTITMWQIVGIGYIASAVLAVLILNFLLKSSNRMTHKFLRYGIFVVFGVVTGLSAYAVAATSIVASIAIYLYKISSFKQLSREDKLGTPIYLATSFAFLLISFNSPGARARKLLLPEAKIENIFPNLPEGVFNGIVNFSNISLHASSLLILFTAALACIALKLRYQNFVFSSLLIVSALLMSVFVSISETLTYGAYYHFSAVRSFWYFGMFLFSVSLFNRLKFSRYADEMSAKNVALFVSILLVSALAFISVKTFESEVLNRYTSWQQGKTYKFVPDIDQPMFEECWAVMEKMRKSQGRESSR